MAEMNGYALAIITRGNPKGLATLRDNFGSFPDEIVVVNTGLEGEEGFAETNEVVKSWPKAKLFFYPWTDNFAEARNFSFDQCTQPFIMWIDTDDTVDEPARFDQNVRMAVNNGADLIQCEYVYERDPHGNVTALQKRERVVRRGFFRWAEQAPIHEVLVSVGNFVPTDMPGKGGRVVHDRVSNDHKRGRECLRRNKKILELHFGEGKKKPEPRMIFYWGNTLLGLGDHHGALEKYKEYIALMENREHRNDAEFIQCLLSMGSCYTFTERFDEAMKVVMRAFTMSPHMPTPYIELAKVFLRKRDFPSAGMYAKLCLERQEGAQYELVSSPREIVGRAHLILAHCCCYAGKYQEALAEAEQAKGFFQRDPQFLQLYHEIKNTLARKDLLNSFVKVRRQLMGEGNVDAARELAACAPQAISDHPDVQVLSRKVRPQGKNTIAIVCYPPEGHAPWGPWSIKEGIGGSEEAVINASSELAKLGWHVEVYAPTGRPCKEGPLRDAHGVLWYRNEAWGGRHDPGLDVAISWRNPALFAQTGTNAAKKYCWMHDIFNPSLWQAGAENFYDAFFFLSDFHRSLFKAVVPDEKVFRTENALDPALFVPQEDLKNEPHRMIWGSDPSRGLQYLLPWWKTIREAVPDATLEVFYGWSSHFMAHMARSPELAEIHKQVEGLKNQDGIHWRGRVGQDVLAKEFAQAAVMPYMTTFPEIHCITALKAQAHGCVVMCPDDFALSETVQHGVKLRGPMDQPERQREFVDRLIEELRNPTSGEKRQEMARWARSKTWASTIARWNELFLSKTPSLSPAPSLTTSLTS